MWTRLTPTRARWIVLCALLITGWFVSLNLRVPSAGIVEHALLDADNPYRRWQTEASAHPQISQGDTLSLVLDFPGGVTPQGLQQIADMSQQVQALFPEAVVWSLAANAYDYRHQQGQISSHAWLQPLPTAEQLPAWKAALQGDRAAYGTLMGRDFDYAQIFVFLPENYHEQSITDRLAEYLEQRPISEIEWLLWKGDIHPAPQFANVSLGGWSVARGLMHYALISDVLFYSTVGLVIATLAAVLSLGSWRQALQVSGVIFMSFVLVRGSIPLLADLGLRFDGQPVAERVYFLLVLSALIVAGISFNVRAFEAYNDAWRRQPEASPASLWAQVGPLGTQLNVVALIAMLNFATLPQIGIRGILEVGVLSALGIAYQRVLVATLLPALHLLVGGTPGDFNASRHPRLGRFIAAYQAAAQAFPQWAYRFWLRRSPRNSLTWALGLTGLTLAGALVIVAHDSLSAHKWVQVLERPIDYLPHTIVDRGRSILNREGGAGFGRLAFMVLPQDPQGSGPAVEDPAFIARTWTLQNDLARLPGAMSVHSILDKLNQVAERSPDRQPHSGAPNPADAPALPRTRQAAHDDLQLLEWDFDQPRLARYFWSQDAYVLFAAHPADDSRSLRLFAEQAMALAHSRYPDLRVLPFGRLHTYHQTDAYISQGKPLNVLTSFPLVVAVCALWLLWARRRGQVAGRHSLHPLRTALAISVPFVFAYALVVVLMAVLGLPLDQATACATALGINAAIDFDIYVVDDFMRGLHAGHSPDQALHRALFERGHITLVDAKLNAVCFSFLMLSPFLPIQRLGVVMLVMLVACAFGALFLMTGVLRSCVSPRALTQADPASPAYRPTTPHSPQP